MLRISKLADYAILVMVELSRRPHAVLNAQKLSELAGIELPTASKVLKQLAQAGLVASYRGPCGGYAVERPAEEISVADVIVAIEGPIGMTECSVNEGLCTVEARCNVRDNWVRISHAVGQALQAVSLAEMAGRAGTNRGAAPRSGIAIATLNS
jgi:FeS assembly SUF system regulator